MSNSVALRPVAGPSAWRGKDLARNRDWVYHFTDDEIEELEEVGRQFVAADPDLRFVTAKEFPLPHCAGTIRSWSTQLVRGRGFVFARGLRTPTYPVTLSGAIFFLLGLHLGQPVHQNVSGDILGHVKARPGDPQKLVSSQTTSELAFHSDSSDVVGLMCLHGALVGGTSRLMSGAAIYNEVLDRRPDLAPLLFGPFYHDWTRQDPNALQNAYDSPMCSWVDETFSIYAGTPYIFSAQEYPEVPRLTEEQDELLHLVDDVMADPDLPLDMDFQPGDVQWLLNAAALHSRTEYVDDPDPAKHRHLLRLWLRLEEPRPVVPRFGKHVVTGRDAPGGLESARHIPTAVVPAWER